MAWPLAIANVTACFRATGVYPVDRRVPLAQLSCEASNPSHDVATPYVPFCTPRKGLEIESGLVRTVLKRGVTLWEETSVGKIVSTQ